MSDKTQELISACVQEIINNSQSQYEDVLFNGVTGDMSFDQVFVKMVYNSIRISVDTSTQIICSLLDSCGVVPFKSDEKEIQKLLLQIRTANLSKSRPE